MKPLKEIFKLIVASAFLMGLLFFYFVALGSYMILALFQNSSTLDKPTD